MEVPILQKLKLKFTSGNSVPVERTSLTRSEFDELMDEFQKMYDQGVKDSRTLERLEGQLLEQAVSQEL